MNRRLLLSLMLASCLAVRQTPARADDDGGSDGGSSGSGSGNSGSGNSGPGNQNDDDGDDDDHGGSSSRSQSRARDAVKSGDAASLRKILSDVKKKYPGEVVSVRLRGSGRDLAYAIKIVDASNRLVTLNVNARTGIISLY